MIRRLVSFMVVCLAGYYVFQNRYRLMNTVLGNLVMRRVLAGSMIGIPGVRNRIMQSVFSGPSDWN
ncbi:hypothetical protein [Bacillus sp. T33-2]|uniref:hypothetical protein n=1 Tax=Bacillus sp. T33-2 TaxID=2054168 RepID=UPI000C77F24B|nr:hypothetical protein [Bacillus sp. T33-2]PLR89492.1 hypothetical protein CVD19_23725 [Bacillus sp. T33-2]